MGPNINEPIYATYRKLASKIRSPRIAISANPVQSIPRSSIVQEENIGNHSRLNCLSRSSPDSVQNTSTHETAIGLCSSSPDGGGNVDELGENVGRSTSERSADWDPDEIGETQDQNGHTSKSNSLG